MDGTPQIRIHYGVSWRTEFSPVRLPKTRTREQPDSSRQHKWRSSSKLLVVPAGNNVIHRSVINQQFAPTGLDRSAVRHWSALKSAVRRNCSEGSAVTGADLVAVSQGFVSMGCESIRSQSRVRTDCRALRPPPRHCGDAWRPIRQQSGVCTDGCGPIREQSEVKADGCPPKSGVRADGYSPIKYRSGVNADGC